MNMNYQVKTNKPFEKAVDDLKESLSQSNFGVLYELNFMDKFKEKNIEFDKNFKVLEVCNPAKAKKVLDENIEAGYFLPCKVVVYENDGSVIIGMPKPTLLINMIESDNLSDIAQEVETILINAINKAK